MIAFLKIVAPLFLYFLGILIVFFSLTGKVKYGIFFLIPMFPLQNIFLKLHHFPLGKDFNDILLIAMFVGWILYRYSKSEPIFEKNSFNKILFFYFIFTYICLWRGSFYLGFPAPLNINDIRVQTWKNYMMFILIFFIVVNNIKNLKQIQCLVLFIVMAMFLMDYYTLNQIRWMSGIASRIAIHGTFVSLGPNEVAAFYATYTFVILGILFIDNNKFRRLIFIAIIILNLNCILFLYSRGAYLAVIIGFLVISVIKKKIFIAPLILLLLFWQAILPLKVVERINQTQTEEGDLDGSSQHRLYLWRDALELFKEKPIMGVGFCVVPFYGLRGGFKDTHNIYMKILAEQGIIGIGFLLFLFWLSLKNGWQLYKNAEDTFLKGLGLGFIACVSAIMVTNIFGDRWTHLQLGAYFWVFLALVVRGNIITQQEKIANSHVGS